MKKEKYRFFKFKVGDFEDYIKAQNLSHACDVFIYHYPKVQGTVQEFWMDEYAPVKKNPIYNKDRTIKVITIN